MDGPFIMPVVDKYKDMGTVLMGKVEAGVTRKGAALFLMPNRVRNFYKNKFCSIFSQFSTLGKVLIFVGIQIFILFPMYYKFCSLDSHAIKHGSKLTHIVGVTPYLLLPQKL